MKCCGLSLTGNAKTLITTALMFSAITVTQFIASLPQFANSLALRADCLSMLVDALSYLGNLAAECNPDVNSKRAVELGVSGVSLALLLGFTTIFLYEGIMEVSGPIDDSSDDDVDPQIVMAFSLLGLIVDGVSLWSFAFCSDVRAPSHGGSLALGRPDNESMVIDESSSSKNVVEGSKENISTNCGLGISATELIKGGVEMEAFPDEAVVSNPPQVSTAGNLNMLSALTHVASDLLRSLTTFIEAVIIMRHPQYDSSKVDGWAALVVCSVIAIGGLSALVTWIGELQADLQLVLKLELSDKNRIQTGESPAREVIKSEIYSCVDQDSDDDADEVDTSFS